MQMFRLTSVALMLSLATPAFAGVNKDMVQLQTQIQQLQDAIARLQQSNDERMGVMKDLVQQSADSVNRLSVNMDALQRQLTAQQTTQGAKTDQVSGQVQALNDSLDEVKARMNRLEKVMTDIQGQTQSINAAMQNAPSSAASSAVVSPAPIVQVPTSKSPSAQRPAVSTLVPAPAPSTRRVPDALAAPAIGTLVVEDLYKAAYGDYMAAKYPVAAAEFGDVIKTYPENVLAGNSFYYLGEIDYRAAKYSAAAKDYDKVLEQFPDSSKIPAAHLHKGQALIALKENEAGVRELRTLIQRFPSSPEASQARSKLNAMGVPIKPRLQ